MEGEKESMKEAQKKEKLITKRQTSKSRAMVAKKKREEIMMKSTVMKWQR